MTWYGMFWFMAVGGCFGYVIGYIARGARIDGDPHA